MDKVSKKAIRLALLLVAIIFILFILNSHFQYIRLDLYGPSGVKNVVAEQLHFYFHCQIDYRNTYKRYASDIDLLGCDFSNDVKIYQSLSEFRKNHPDMCINMSLGVEPDSFTVIAEGNIDGEMKMYYGNDEKFLVGSPICR